VPRWQRTKEEARKLKDEARRLKEEVARATASSADKDTENAREVSE
jgi:hypothetical protein